MTEHRATYQVREPNPTSPYQEVRFPDGWLAFRYDPSRGIVEIQRRGQKYCFDLTSICTVPLDKSK